MLHTIDYNNLFNVVFLDFWEPGDIQYCYGSCNIMTCMDCMTGFGLGESSGSKEITPKQVARWDFGNFFVPFRIPKIIVVDADGFFLERLRRLSKIPY